MNDNDATQNDNQGSRSRADRFRLWNMQNADEVPQYIPTPQEAAERRTKLRWIILGKAQRTYGWRGLLTIGLACWLAALLGGIDSALKRVVQRDALEDPALRDIIALWLMDVVPDLPKRLFHAMLEWEEWRYQYGYPESLRRWR